ncbi:hypothetical protein FHS29_000985 [Saccharothrix tamanrassetensis]|uniref:Uncharacterized protein n=1 Tax=Saccharothrix tamanrassetensis TaxID=1051531 RepID=A0A841CEG8_9PSEU|nr:hypothetical protein [Saccharothrix tamanrassetensis]
MRKISMKARPVIRPERTIRSFSWFSGDDS